MEFNELIELGYHYYPTSSNKLKYDRNDVIDLHLGAFNNLSQTDRDKYEKENISDCEYFAYVLLIGFAAQEIQYPLRNNFIPNSFIQEIIKHLDSFLMKVERTLEKTVYRQDKYSDIKYFKKGKTIKFPTFLNTSIDNYDNTKNIIWVISILQGNSKGHNVYKIYDHGNEKQITFERNSSFLINSIEKTADISYIYCEEIL